MVCSWRRISFIGSKDKTALLDLRFHFRRARDHIWISEEIVKALTLIHFNNYSFRHLPVTALPTGKKILENKGIYKRTKNLKTIRRMRLASRPLYDQQRRLQ